MGIGARTSSVSAQTPSEDSQASNPPQKREATGPHPVATSQSHTVLAAVCVVLSRRPSAILSGSQIVEQLLPCPSVVVRSVDEARIWQTLSKLVLGEVIWGAIIPLSFFPVQFCVCRQLGIGPQ